MKRPPWLTGEERGRGVVASMDWVPVITFVQIMIDSMNAMRVVPGQFKSFGHDYRADTTDFVHAAYHLPEVTDVQRKAVVDTLLQLEVERGERIKRSKEEAKAAAGEKPKRAKRSLWLRDRTKQDADVPAAEISPGEAKADIQ